MEAEQLTSGHRSDQLKDDEIRMLNINPGSGYEQLNCTLERTSRIDPRPYSALSYVWGDQTERQAILINDSVCYVGRNLWDALVHLRRSDASVRIWADALCIDQDDLDERSRQVQRMGEVFARAEEVFIWLGKARGHSKTLKDAYDWVANSSRLAQDERRSKLLAFWDLLSRPWFSRLWVLQEAALARKATIVLGEERCDLAVLRLMVWDDPGVEEIQEAFLRQLKESPTLHIVNISSLVHLLECLRGRSQTSFESLVYDCMRRACIDPRDHIFGLVGVAHYLNLETPKVDYTMSNSEVFYHFMKAALKQRPDDLVEFAVVDSRQTPEDWPSWVPDLASTARRSDFARTVYEAGYPLDRTLSDESFSDSKRHLFLSGINFDTVRADHCPEIDLIPMRETDEIVPLLPRFKEYGLIAEKFWAEHLSNKSAYGDHDGQSQAFWRTLIANEYCGQPRLSDSHYESGAAESDEGQVYDYIMGRAPMPLHVPGFEPHAGGTKTAIGNFMGSVSLVLPGRALFHTDHGYIGVGPAGLMAGDAIVVICGIRMPLILRRQSCQGEGVWRFIGPAYVHGIMKGEVMEGKREDDLEQFTVG